MSEYTDKINELTGKMVKGDDDKWALPEEDSKDLDEATLHAVTAERRYRDTQGAYTKANQDAIKSKAVADGLRQHALEQGGTLTKEQSIELAGLKTSDPEAWRTKLNEYESTARTTLSEELDEIAVKSANKSEVEIREEQMAAWSESTGIELTQAVVENDLPPRFMRKLEAGDITFAQFLEEAGTYLKAGKIIKGSDDTDSNDPNLSDAAGGSAPSDTANAGDFEESYDTVVF